MKQSEFHEKIMYKLGSIEEQVKMIKPMDDRLRCVEKKMNSILAYAAGVGAMGSFVVLFAKDWFKRFF